MVEEPQVISASNPATGLDGLNAAQQAAVVHV